MRSSIAFFVVIFRPRIDRDRAATGGEPASCPGLREAVARLSFRERRGARQKSLVRESADRAPRWHRGEEGRKVGIPGKSRVPRDRGDRVARELDHARTRSADVEDVERRAARAVEDAQVVRGSKPPVLAFIEGVATSPDRGREKDAVGVFGTRRGQLGERLRDRVKRPDDAIGVRAQIAEDALRTSEALENSERREDRRDERRVREDLADQAQAVQELLERGLADGFATDARPVLGIPHGVALQHRMAVLAVAVPGSPRLGVVMRARVVFDQVELMPLGERDRRLRELRRSLVLVRIEVPPHRERGVVDGVAAERSGDALERLHRSAKVVSVMP